MITGNAIDIRHVRKTELEALIARMNDLEIRGIYLPSSLRSPELQINEFEKNGMSTDEYERLLIVAKEGGLLGTIWHFKSVPYFNAREIGYTLFEQGLRGKGIVSEAVGLLTDYLFRSLLINRLEIRMDTRNIASERVAQKCGYQREGVAREANFVQGKHVDMFVYSLLRREWEK